MSAAAASAAALFIITRSGLVGTAAGAAVFSVVSTGVAYGVRAAFLRVADWWRPSADLRDPALPDPDLHDFVDGVHTDAVTRPSDLASSTGGAHDSRPEPMPPTHRHVRSVPRIRPAALAPWVLAVVALGLSVYTVAAGVPMERVVLRERVVERPVVEERVVVQTVTVTAPEVAAGRSGESGPTPDQASDSAADAPPTSDVTTTVVPDATVTTLPEATVTTQPAGGPATTVRPASPPTTAAPPTTSVPSAP